MERLSPEDRKFFETMIRCKPQDRNGYMVFQKQIEGKRYRVKRSRAFIQLHLGMKLEIWEHVHHKDGNRSNDEINNLLVINSSDHSSLHGGKKQNA